MEAQERAEANRPRPAPAEMIQAQPWTFLALAFTGGLAAGLLLRFIGWRKTFRLYLMARRFV